MLSHLVEWDWLVGCAHDTREALPPHLLTGYELVDSAWDDDGSGEDVHLYKNPFGVVVLVWPYDDEADPPDPWSDDYRAEVAALVDGAQFYASFREAAAAIRESGATAGTAARILPALDRFTVCPPNHSASLQ